MACRGGVCALQPGGGGSFGGGGNFASMGSQKIKEGRLQNYPTVTPDVMAAIQKLLQGGLQQYGQSPYEGFGDLQQQAQAGFEPIEQQAREGFTTQTIPGLAERFTALGSGGSQNSSAFQGALGAAGSGLERQLAAMKAQYGQTNLQDLLGYGQSNRQYGLQQLQMGMQPTFSTMYQPKGPSFWQSLVGNMGQAGGNLLNLGARSLMGGF